MSDWDTGDMGHDGGDVDYGHYATGQESSDLDQLHQASGSESDYNNDVNVYDQDSSSAESTDFAEGHHVEIDDPRGGHFEQTDFTNYSNDSASSDHVFAAEGSESAHNAQFAELDALRAQFDTSSAEGTEFHGGSAQFGVASN